MNKQQGLNLDPHPADPLARLQYLDKRLALCGRAMTLAVSIAVASWLLVDVIGGPVPMYVFGGAALVSGFCALSGDRLAQAFQGNCWGRDKGWA